MTPETELKELSIPAPNVGRMEVRIVGKTPYMRNPPTERVLRTIAGGEESGTSGKSEKLTPEEEVQEKLEAMLVEPAENGGQPTYGMPPVAFVEGMAAAGYRLGDWNSMVELKGALSVPSPTEIPIEAPQGPERDSRLTNLSGRGGTKVTHRPKFFPWSATFPIEFDRGVLNEKQVIRLLNDMGRGVGVGAYRPENGGPFGTFEVETAQVPEGMTDAEEDSGA